MLLGKSKQKNTNIKYKDLVKHHYNKTDVIATNVSSILIKNNLPSHAYLSIAINHKTKFIESQNISLKNDNDLIMSISKTLI